MSEFSQFSEFCRRVYPLLFCHRRVTALSFDEWVSRFNANTQAQLVLARRDWESGRDCIKDAMFIKYFVKMEMGFKPQDEVGETETKPRIISSASPHYNCIVGPWVAACQKTVKYHHHSRIVVCESRRTAFGAWFHAHRDELGVECDFSTYDATQIVEARMLIIELWRLYHRMPHDVYRLMTERARLKVGRGVHGTYCRVEGTMASGDPDTFLGNTVLNVLSQFYAYCCARGVGPEEAIATYSIAASGDDSYAFDRTRDVAPSQMEATLSRLGFDAKMVVHTTHNDWSKPYGFCSSYFVPTDTSHYLGPKPGRILAKLGWVRVGGDLQTLRANMLGVWASVSRIPFAREYVEHHLRLTAKVQAGTAEERHTFTSDTGNIDQATHAWALEYYCITQAEYDDWVEKLSRTRLGDEFDHRLNELIFQNDL
jgi:hypothetical protein